MKLRPPFSLKPLSQCLKLFCAGALIINATPVLAQASTPSKPNIIVIMGDDIGWFNIGAYHQGMMAAKTPNLLIAWQPRHAHDRLLC